MKVVISANTTWNLVNFRLGLIHSMISAGVEVVAAAPADASLPTLQETNCRFIDLPMSPRGTSLIGDSDLLRRYVRLMRAELPGAFLAFTIKPNIYGSIAARMHGVRTINNISGLGTVFSKQTMLTVLVRRLYRHALAASHTVFFQNPEDRKLFEAAGLVRAGQASLLPGSGINLSAFVPPEAPPGRKRFLLAGRLLWDKGVAEFIDAARMVRVTCPEAEFYLLGFVKDGDKGSVSTADLARWSAEGVATYLGETSDVRPHFARADCIVLPSSYNEGTPRTLIEAAAMGRPAIASDIPGCRNAVVDGKTGFLVPAKDKSALASAMMRFIALEPQQVATMAAEARRFAESRFDEAIVVRAYLDALNTDTRASAVLEPST